MYVYDCPPDIICEVYNIINVTDSVVNSLAFHTMPVHHFIEFLAI